RHSRGRPGTSLGAFPCSQSDHCERRYHSPPARAATVSIKVLFLLRLRSVRTANNGRRRNTNPLGVVGICPAPPKEATDKSTHLQQNGHALPVLSDESSHPEQAQTELVR